MATQDFSFRELVRNIAQSVKWLAMLILLIVSFVFRIIGEVARLVFNALTFIIPLIYKPVIWLICCLVGMGGLAFGGYYIRQAFGGNIIALLPMFVMTIVPVTILLEVGLSWGGLAIVGLAVLAVGKLLMICPIEGRLFILFAIFVCCILYERIRQ